ncbi:hypothetical protein [Parasphingorhabdus sp.]|uniref:hypothetical protein n=1 Tax=Parasphingorhabdus sp. TaxID=2709688 RepID=UPI002F92DB3C
MKQQLSHQQIDICNHLSTKMRDFAMAEAKDCLPLAIEWMGGACSTEETLEVVSKRDQMVVAIRIMALEGTSHNRPMAIDALFKALLSLKVSALNRLYKERQKPKCDRDFRKLLSNDSV